MAGGTELTIFGSGLVDLGDMRIRIGRYGAVQATAAPDGSNVTLSTPR